MTHGTAQVERVADTAEQWPPEQLHHALRVFAAAVSAHDTPGAVNGVADVFRAWPGVAAGPEFVCVSARTSPARAARTVGCSDELASRADAQQFALDEGPCLDALAGNAVIADEVGLAQRWPRFAEWTLSNSPFRSVISRPLPTTGQRQAAATFYISGTQHPATLSISSVTATSALAVLALAALDEHERAENLLAALTSNRQIGAAVGVLMAEHKWTYDYAFDVMRRASQQLGVKIRSLADDIVLTGALPTRCGPATALYEWAEKHR